MRAVWAHVNAPCVGKARRHGKSHMDILFLTDFILRDLYLLLCGLESRNCHIVSAVACLADEDMGRSIADKISCPRKYV